MDVILRQAVENLGKPGDVVKVSNGYARNYLLPRGIAFEATGGNLKRIAQEKTRLEAMPAFQVENRVQGIKPGASVIATVTDPQGDQHPALIVQRFGSGRVGALTIGDRKRSKLLGATLPIGAVLRLSSNWRNW